MWWIRRSMMATGRWLPTRRAKPKRWSGATLLPETWPMQRSEVWWVEFDPAVGSEIRKTRPAVIVSNNAANRNLARWWFCRRHGRCNAVKCGGLSLTRQSAARYARPVRQSSLATTRPTGIWRGGGCAVDQQHWAAVPRRDGGDGRRAEQQGNGRPDHGCRQGAAQKPDWYFIQSRYVGR